MQIQVVKSKIHRVKVTGADLNYIGSVTIDEDLIIERVSGSQSEKDALYDPVSSKAVSMEILPSGEIIFSLQEG